MSKDETAVPTGISLTHLDPVFRERPNEVSPLQIVQNGIDLAASEPGQQMRFAAQDCHAGSDTASQAWNVARGAARPAKTEFSLLKTYLMGAAKFSAYLVPQVPRASNETRRAPQEMEKQIMTMFKTAGAAMLASMLIAAPVFAQSFGNGGAYDSYADMGPAHAVHHGRTISRDVTAPAEVAPSAYGMEGRVCIPAPRVGAFATQPWDTQTPCEPSY